VSLPTAMPDAADQRRRQTRAWRAVVGIQATVILLILASLLAVLLTGVFDALFTQRSL
jgi:hypothetical protein